MTAKRGLSEVAVQISEELNAALAEPEPEPEQQTSITEPGIYDLDPETYHGDPVDGGSLSSSGCKVILDCPAKFVYQREHGRPPKTEFDIGHAAHLHVLGKGADLAVGAFKSWQSNDAKAFKAKAYKEGKTPLLPEQYERVLAMAAKLREHPVASKLFTDGEPEQSLIWHDDDHGIWRRRMLDWLPGYATQVGGTWRYLVPDYKTCASARPKDIDKAINEHGYHIDAAWSIDAIRALGIHPDPIFVLVFQEREPPHVVTIAYVDGLLLEAGQHYARKAIRRFIECTERGEWPGYTEQIHRAQMPPWHERAYLEEIY